MQLRIDDTLHTFTPIAAFREAHGLPATFAMARFQPKDGTGLGSIDRAGPALQSIREALLKAVPVQMTATETLEFVPQLAQQFERALRGVNERVGLREPEIEFAVQGLQDMLMTLAYALVRATASGTRPAFEAVYAAWLFDSVRVAATPLSYEHAGRTYGVRVVIHAYGRVGLIVQTEGEAHYLIDKALACPVEGFMAGLLAELGNRMIEAI